MSFLGLGKPERPRPIPVAAEPVQMAIPGRQTDPAASYASLISTGVQGLKRKATTTKSSLIGGTSST